jgi:hypothetical protein
MAGPCGELGPRALIHSTSYVYVSVGGVVPNRASPTVVVDHGGLAEWGA